MDTDSSIFQRQLSPQTADGYWLHLKAVVNWVTDKLTRVKTPEGQLPKRKDQLLMLSRYLKICLGAIYDELERLPSSAEEIVQRGRREF